MEQVETRQKETCHVGAIKERDGGPRACEGAGIARDSRVIAVRLVVVVLCGDGVRIGERGRSFWSES